MIATADREKLREFRRTLEHVDHHKIEREAVLKLLADWHPEWRLAADSDHGFVATRVVGEARLFAPGDTAAEVARQIAYHERSRQRRSPRKTTATKEDDHE